MSGGEARAVAAGIAGISNLIRHPGTPELASRARAGASSPQCHAEQPPVQARRTLGAQGRNQAGLDPTRYRLAGKDKQRDAGAPILMTDHRYNRASRAGSAPRA
jgi:hypothetical protein